MEVRGLRLIFMGLAAAAIALTACDDGIVSICHADSPARQEFDRLKLDAGGVWELTLINGEAIPATGYVLPAGGDRLRSGTLTFKPTAAFFSDCEQTPTEMIEEGIVVARYLLADESGTPKFPSKTYTASYSYNHIDKTLVIKAAGETVDGERDALDAMTFSKGHVIFGDYSLTFER